MRGPNTKPGDSCCSSPLRSGLEAAPRLGEPPGPLSGTRHHLVVPSHSGFCFLFCGTGGGWLPEGFKCGVELRLGLLEQNSTC